MELNRVDPPERFLRGQPQPIRQARRRWLRRGLFRLFVVFLGPGLAMLVLLFAIVSRPEFQLNRILVEGNQRLTHGEILALMQGDRSSNVLTMNLVQLRRKLLRSAWVKDVEITRMLPGSLTLRITERVPVGVAVLEKQLYLLSEDGTLLDEFAAKYGTSNPILIRGLRDENGVVAQRIEVAGRLARQISDHDQLSQIVSEIDLQHGPDSVRLNLSRPPITVLGRHDSLLERLDEAIPLTQELTTRFDDVGTLDLRFAKRAFLRKTADRAGIADAMVGGELF